MMDHGANTALTHPHIYGTPWLWKILESKRPFDPHKTFGKWTGANNTPAMEEAKGNSQWVLGKAGHLDF